jgi:copper/silver efflux system protein
VHRLRPKLLTEGTVVIGLAPMLWASGVGAEIIRPLAAPVLGCILVADEVIDLFLPVLFYRVRRWHWERLHAPDIADVPNLSRAAQSAGPHQTLPPKVQT